MRCPSARSRSLALMALALGVSAATSRPSAYSQEARPSAASDSGSKLDKQIEELDRTIGQRIEAGRIGDAIPTAREKLDLLIRLRGKDHWQTGDARRDIETYERLIDRPREVQDRFAEACRGAARARQLDGQGQYAPASELFQKTLAVDREILGEDHPETAMIRGWVASTLWSQGKYPEAEAMQRRILATYLKTLGEDHPETANGYDNLALTLGRQGKPAEAEAMHRRALAIRLKALPEGHSDIAKSYNNLAEILQAQGKYAEAEAMHRRALAINLKALGEDHAHTAASYHNLALSLWAQGKYVEAEAMLRRALSIRLKVQDEDHPHTAYCYSSLAEVLRAQRKDAEAEAMLRRALAILLKALGEGHPDTATSYNNLALTLAAQGKHAEAEAMQRRVLEIQLKALGQGHPHTAVSYNNLALTLAAQGKHAEAEAMQRKALTIYLEALGEGHPDTATAYTSLARMLSDQERYGEAEAMLLRALAIQLKALGEGHPHTARSYSRLAEALRAQVKYSEAEAMYRRALAIQLKALGEGHPDTAASYQGLAEILRDQGKYPEAEAMQRRSLAIKLKTRGEESPETAANYNNLALTLAAQGKYAEAEAMHRRSLAIKLKALGMGHPDTVSSYANLASSLQAQGKFAEAEAMLRRALAIQLKALPEGHPDTATGYSSLAVTLFTGGKSAEAEAMQRKALAIYLKALPEGHPYTATAYRNLAGILSAQGRHGEAEAMHRHALAICLKTLGEGHSDTARSYKQLAQTLSSQGKDAEAEAMLRRALAILLKALGEGHPSTSDSYHRLAHSLDSQGKHDEAISAWRSATASYEQGRTIGPRGLEAALGENSPLSCAAVALARAGRPREAWASWERGLARGLADEVTRRAARPLTAAERDREAALLDRGQATDERINRLMSARALTNEQEKTLDDLRQQASEVRRQLLELDRQFEEKYGALASRPATLEEAQKALPEGTALLGWIDTRTEHWACLLARSVDPVWVHLTGSGKDGAWTSEQEGLPGRLRAELNPETTRGQAGPLAEALARQRLEPLKEHLGGIRRLIVVNSPGMAGVPVDALMAVRLDPAWDAITVSYAPSAAMFSDLAGRPIPSDRPATLLAVADPAYPEPRGDGPAPEPPGSGIAVARVLPNGNADLNGLRAGDILLSYAGTELKQAGDLKPVASDGGPRKIPARYWREGITRDIELAAGPLGVAIDLRPAAAVVRARRESERVLLGMRGGSHARLPGTRREVQALAALFPNGKATTILGPRACEATVQGLARSDKLKGYRYLHFATHGESDPRFAYHTALILAPDPDAGADPTATETDGTITAEQIARTWDLDADLVVLSACDSGLGRADAGEGYYLGFAQPLFARGARSLVLSQWKVDDDATALLMARFYRNLLGKREGLTAPMPKAEALAEAKRWLRGAGPAEVGAALTGLPRGEIVRREAVKAASSSHPYENPIYWAGFILVGAPD